MTARGENVEISAGLEGNQIEKLPTEQNKGFIIKECIGKIDPDAYGNSPIIMLQWKKNPKLKGNYDWRYAHVSLNHDSGRKGNLFNLYCGIIGTSAMKKQDLTESYG